jgi:hypothetical protein
MRFPSELLRAKSKISGQRDGNRPQLCREIVSIYVHVRWFIWFLAVEIEPSRVCSNSRRHGLILQNCTLFRTGID